MLRGFRSLMALTLASASLAALPACGEEDVQDGVDQVQREGEEAGREAEEAGKDAARDAEKAGEDATYGR